MIIFPSQNWFQGLLVKELDPIDPKSPALVLEFSSRIFRYVDLRAREWSPPTPSLPFACFSSPSPRLFPPSRASRENAPRGSTDPFPCGHREKKKEIFVVSLIKKRLTFSFGIIFKLFLSFFTYYFQFRKKNKIFGWIIHILLVMLLISWRSIFFILYIIICVLWVKRLGVVASREF